MQRLAIREQRALFGPKVDLFAEVVLLRELEVATHIVDVLVLVDSMRSLLWMCAVSASWSSTMPCPCVMIVSLSRGACSL